MTKKTNRSVQYFAGICGFLFTIVASFAFTFTGATLSWPSPVIPKFKNGDANIELTDIIKLKLLVNPCRHDVRKKTYLYNKIREFVSVNEPSSSNSSIPTLLKPSVEYSFQKQTTEKSTRQKPTCSYCKQIGHRNQGQISWIVALVPLGALPGCYIGQVLSERLGRRRTVLSAALPGIAGAVMILFTKIPAVMFIARVLMGISNGITAVVTMVYLTEIADKEIRGALGMLVQVMINVGALTMYGIGPFVSYNVVNSILTTIPILCLLLCLWIPESPYYHLKNSRFAAAKKEYMVIKRSKDAKAAEEELRVIRAHVRESMENESTMKELFFKDKYRRAVYIIIGLKVLQYMTGSLAIQSYLEIIFRQSSSISGPYASIVYGFVQLGAGVGATFLPDYFGRRILMTVSCLGVAISLTVVGLYFYLQDTMSISADMLATLSSVPLVGVLGFNILYAFGIGNIPYIMQAELFPINVKTVASSSATMLACVLNFAVTKSYQGIKDVFGHYTVFWAFALVAYTGVLFIYLFVPETKGKTLEEIQEMQEKHLEVEMLEISNDRELKDEIQRRSD